METLIELIISKQSGVLARVLAGLSPMGLSWKNHRLADGEDKDSHNLRIIASGDDVSLDQLRVKFSGINGVIEVLNIDGSHKLEKTVKGTEADNNQNQLVTTLLQRRLLTAKAGMLNDSKQLDSARSSPPNEIDFYFSCILQELFELMGKVGGDNFKHQLEECIVSAAMNYGWDLEEYTGSAKIEDISVFSKHYRDIAKIALKFSVNLLGKNLVLDAMEKLHLTLRDSGLTLDEVSGSFDAIFMVEEL